MRGRWRQKLWDGSLWRFMGQLVWLTQWQREPVSNKMERIDTPKFSPDPHMSTTVQTHTQAYTHITHMPTAIVP